MNIKYYCESPFDGYYFKRLYKKEGRMRIDITSKNKTKITMNYARYLMCVKEGRILLEEEQVHHIDEDRLNDDIDNLQILSDKEHGKIHHTEKEYVILHCMYCMKEFKRQAKNHRTAMKREANIFCSQSCSSKFKNFKFHKKIKINILIK